MKIRAWIVLLIVATLAMTAVSAFAVGVSDKQRLNSIVDRMLRNEPVSPAEKAEAYPLYLERERANTGSNAIDAQGGPDAFGYKFIDNNGEAGGPTFGWIDISATGTNVGVSGDDATSAALPIGFTFNYYGNAYTTFKACTNGWLSLDAATTSTAYTNSNLPATGVPNTTIAPFWDDQLVSAVGNFKYQSFGTYLVVSWTTTSYSGGSGTFNYQAILNADGTIKFQYNTLGTSLASATIGIENSTGTVGLPYNYNSGTVRPAAASRAVLYYTLSAPTYTSPANGATNVVTNASLIWNAASGATGYNVNFGTDNPPMTTVSTGQAGLTYAPTLDILTTYYWQITASNGSSTATGPVWSFTTGAGAAPNAPTAGNITGISNDGMTFNWTDNASNETGYNLYISTDGTTYGAAIPLGIDANTYNVSGVGPNAGYWFQVKAVNLAGESDATSANAYTYANAPQTPTVGSPTFSSLTVTPNDASSPNPAATTFAIHETTTNQYVQASGALGASAVWNLLGNWGSKVVTGLAGATSYTFEVKARNGANVETAFSGTASGTTTNWSVNTNLWSSSTPITIADNVTNTGTITIADTRAITDLDVKIDGVHTWVSDVDMYLNSPNATRIRLFPMGTGGSGDNWVNTIFNDEAPASITTGSPPFTGEWIPASPLSGFDGEVVDGVWTFETYDNYGGDTGSITGWSLAFGLATVVANNPSGEGSQLPFTPTIPGDPTLGGTPPVGVTFPPQTGPATNPGTVEITIHPTRPVGVNPAQLPVASTINRFWEVHTSTTNFENATLVLRFGTADLPAGITDPMTCNPPLTVAYSGDGGLTWTPVNSYNIALVSPGVWEVTIPGLNHFSLWGLGNGGLLPVELSAFTGTAGNNQVTLNWRTESETNHEAFRIYRSNHENARGSLIASMRGGVNSSTTRNYRFTDTDVVNGVTYYYRLADVDANGVETMHRTIVTATPAAVNTNLPNEFGLMQNFPNPFNPTTEISYTLKENAKVELKVFDISGREVATLVSANQARSAYRVQFDATHLAAGVYIYQLRANDYYSARKMVLVK